MMNIFTNQQDSKYLKEMFQDKIDSFMTEMSSKQSRFDFRIGKLENNFDQSMKNMKGDITQLDQQIRNIQKYQNDFVQFQLSDQARQGESYYKEQQFTSELKILKNQNDNLENKINQLEQELQDFIKNGFDNNLMKDSQKDSIKDFKQKQSQSQNQDESAVSYQSSIQNYEGLNQRLMEYQDSTNQHVQQLRNNVAGFERFIREINKKVEEDINAIFERRILYQLQQFASKQEAEHMVTQLENKVNKMFKDQSHNQMHTNILENSGLASKNQSRRMRNRTTLQHFQDYNFSKSKVTSDNVSSLLKSGTQNMNNANNNIITPLNNTIDDEITPSNTMRKLQTIRHLDMQTLTHQTNAQDMQNDSYNQPKLTNVFSAGQQFIQTPPNESNFSPMNIAPSISRIKKVQQKNITLDSTINNSTNNVNSTFHKKRTSTPSVLSGVNKQFLNKQKINFNLDRNANIVYQLASQQMQLGANIPSINDRIRSRRTSPNGNAPKIVLKRKDIPAFGNFFTRDNQN